MPTRGFPELDPNVITGTRDALHAYALVLGDYPSSLRARRKHWWQISLRPSVDGMSTGVVRSDSMDFELVLDAANSSVHACIAGGRVLNEPLRGQPAEDLATKVGSFLVVNGFERARIPKHTPEEQKSTSGYSADVAKRLASAWNGISAAMETFQAGIAEETSPIQLWPHHFDLAMMWLPGEKITGQDPADEEYSDKQMNFGFTFGDSGIPEPYFYVTAYPLPDAFPSLKLPTGTVWHSQGFSGAVLPYRELTKNPDPAGYLLDLWNGLYSAGREHLLTVNA